MDPPPAKRSAHDETKTESSKRTKPSSTNSSFTDTKKNKIHAMYSKRCWVCGQGRPNVAHIIVQADEMFEDLKQFGRFNIQSLSSVDNAIPLCGSCHNQYDEIWKPGLMIVPTNIQYFHEVEMIHQQMLMNGSASTRIPPSIIDYAARCSEESGTYQCYVLHDWLGDDSIISQIGKYFGPKQWHGDPLAILHRAFRHVACTRGLPRPLVVELRQLQDLYDTSDNIKKSQDLKTAQDQTGNDTGKAESTRGNQSNFQDPSHQKSRDASLAKTNPSTSGQHYPSTTNILAMTTSLDPLNKSLTSRQPILPALRSPPSSILLHRSPSSSSSQARSFKRIKTDHRASCDQSLTINHWQYGPQNTAQDAIDYRRNIIEPVIARGLKADEETLNY